MALQTHKIKGPAEIGNLQFAKLNVAGSVPVTSLHDPAAAGLSVCPVSQHDAQPAAAHTPAARITLGHIATNQRAVTLGIEIDFVTLDDCVKLTWKQLLDCTCR